MGSQIINFDEINNSSNKVITEFFLLLQGLFQEKKLKQKIFLRF